MLIGSDFEKIKIEVFDLILLEPNAMLGDLILFCCAIYFAFQIKKTNEHSPFFKNWYWFFISFGIGFLAGGISHLFYYYLGVNGKYIPWYLGLLNSYFIEMAMISIFPIQHKIPLFNKLIQTKLLLSCIVATYIYANFDLNLDQKIGLLVPTLNSVIGLLISLGVLGFYYSQKIHSGFLFFTISIFILIPTAFLQNLKINLHPWFDRNDASHVLLLIGLFMYYKGVISYHKHLHQ
ncbi:MAG: hypothetical protein IPM51_11375 [Sphingobacteriaceae bacterium]|nr:hypothetical protein [Sphingobacteriaceae bacterium]